jgi:outer membrane PBP1 activator LpoA protein
MLKYLYALLFSVIIVNSCARQKDNDYQKALLRVKDFLAFYDSLTKNSASIHQLQYINAQAEESVKTRIIPHLDSISTKLKETKRENIQILKAYLELYFKESKSAEEYNKLKALEKDVEKILKEARRNERDFKR